MSGTSLPRSAECAAGWCPEPENEPTTAVESSVDRNLWDHEPLMEQIGDDIEFLARPRGMFLKDSDVAISMIREAHERSDAKVMVAGGHKLKGLALTIFAGSLAKAALDLENMGAVGECDPEDGQLAELVASGDRVLEAMDRLIGGVKAWNGS